jgi:hypothetical protein
MYLRADYRMRSHLEVNNGESMGMEDVALVGGDSGVVLTWECGVGQITCED